MVESEKCDSLGLEPDPGAPEIPIGVGIVFLSSHNSRHGVDDDEIRHVVSNELHQSVAT